MISMLIAIYTFVHLCVQSHLCVYSYCVLYHSFGHSWPSLCLQVNNLTNLKYVELSLQQEVENKEK